MLTEEIIRYIERSVLCWLATSSKDNEPNVSPKEVFTYSNSSTILVANIASPQTVKNIKHNEKVCISFIDVFVQKGFQLKGTARIVTKSEAIFTELEKPLLQITQGKFPFSSITEISITHIKPIIAPKYILFPETTEKQQIESAIKTYQKQQKL